MEHQSKKMKSNPITPRQKEILIEFISSRREMYTGKLTLMYTRERMVKNWQEVTNLLNSVPDGPAKDWKQWRKSWVDIKKNTKSRHSEQKKYMVGTGGGPPPFFPPADLPAIEEKVLNIITPLAISGNKNILETDALFEFETDTSENIDNVSTEVYEILEENIPESVIRSYASENDNTSNFVKDNHNFHNYCVTENSKQQSTPKKSEVDVGNTKTPNGGSSRKKRITKSARLQYSLKNNDKFLKLSEENINFEKEYKQKKLLLLENEVLQKSRYYERKAVALETIANAHRKIAMDILDIKNAMIQNK